MGSRPCLAMVVRQAPLIISSSTDLPYQYGRNVSGGGLCFYAFLFTADVASRTGIHEPVCLSHSS